MTTINDLVFAIDETHKKFPENNFASIYSQIIAGVPDALKFITTANGARERVARLTPVEIVQILCQEIVKIYNYSEVVRRTDETYLSATRFVDQYNALSQKCPGYETVSRLIRVFSTDKVNPVAYLLENNEALMDALHIVQKYYYEYDQKYRLVLEKYGDGKAIENANEVLVNKINSSANILRAVRELEVNQHAVNKCYHDVMKGIQVKNRYNEYGIGGKLFATQHVGLKRHNQEDSVLIMEHPSNPDFKILVVSDGMGGLSFGEEVSSYVVREMAKWFESISPDYFNKPEDLQRLFNQRITQINEAVYRRFNEGSEEIRAGATFTGAIVTAKKTIITQIGDSRAYIVKNGSLLKRDSISLITRDDTFTWPRGEDFKQKSADQVGSKTVEDIKFAHGNFNILRCIGDESLNVGKQSFTIPNESYDKLLLMSDGASDLLSFEGIKIICRSTPLPKITQYLVAAALRKKAIRGREWNGFYEKLVKGTLTQEELDKYNSLKGKGDGTHVDFIDAGKDNTTVAGYFRR